jgi:phage anti-repressor protein
MQELIHVTTNEQGSRVVSARELYDFLEIKRDFSNWCKQMFEYGFDEGKDFTPILAKSIGGRPSIEYVLTLDTAKEIAMLQRSDKGKQARQYFIECERQLKAQVALTPSQALLQQVQLMVDIEQRQTATEAKVLEIEAKLTTRPEYFTVMGYAMLTKVKVGLSIAAQIGRRAKTICLEKGYPIDKIKDPRFGEVGCYPTDVLQQAFAAQTF